MLSLYIFAKLLSFIILLLLLLLSSLFLLLLSSGLDAKKSGLPFSVFGLIFSEILEIFEIFELLLIF